MCINIDDNIDRICFSLVCKRWYNDRDKYLIFNTDNINLFKLKNTVIFQNYKQFNLPSYHNIFMKSIQSKTNYTLSYGDYNKYYKNYDYYYDQVENLNSIPSNVSDIDITYYPHIKNRDNEFKKLYRLISESQSVTKLNGCSTLKYGLPKSIKSITFYNFNEPLVKGSLPNSLEVLVFDIYFKQELLPGVLPDGLLSLTLNNYPHEIQAGVFPDGLLSLTLNNYQHEIQAGVLPSTLKCLTLFDVPVKGVLRYSDESISWEDSVITKCYIPISWLQAISSLVSLESLDIYISKYNKDENVFNLKYLPPNLKFLDITIPSVILKGTMPTSLKTLNLVDSRFNIDEIFPETLQYHFEFFDYENDRILNFPSNIKIDLLFISGELRESTISLPSGISSINIFSELSNSSSKIIEFGGDEDTDQTCPLTELRLPTFKNGTPKCKLPNTIQHLDIGNNIINDILHLIPPTLNTLEFSKLSKFNTIPSTIKSITNIIRRFDSFTRQTIRKLDDNYSLVCDEIDNQQNFKLVGVNSIAKLSSWS
ncbi:hypothetical protein PPL_10888 [Heterostelium album PN500]|uniref:FNIP repeat-containing protein n=1 Tax=Heterostelium pallidum (strain ATCC 26659 / Pp 5 / PN500) TaxID=670386 RepID=D3BS96_HETP5|nr:hypothetical protein PPL_10888 [Heterostelium album PN500]EFA75833.1 hypothetical protein PPL_10888 [Heterostelium album PN500]|eukprot:XP_020427967.1 hypothetical protein PPL_10888 [Heterostelium album PN500]